MHLSGHAWVWEIQQNCRCPLSVCRTVAVKRNTIAALYPHSSASVLLLSSIWPLPWFMFCLSVNASERLRNQQAKLGNLRQPAGVPMFLPGPLLESPSGTTHTKTRMPFGKSLTLPAQHPTSSPVIFIVEVGSRERPPHLRPNVKCPREVTSQPTASDRGVSSRSALGLTSRPGNGGGKGA